MGLTKKKISFDSISKSRGALFGIAVLFIVMFHSYNIHFMELFSSKEVFKHLNFICSMGNTGVDIFIILSGVGLYYSLTKDPSIKHFYKKRAIRIFPSLIIFSAILYSLLWAISAKEFFLNMAGLGLIFNGKWFFTLLIPMYIVFPLLYKAINKFNWIAAVIIIAFVIAINLLLRLNLTDFYTKYEIAFTRIPAFVVGTLLGKLAYDKKELPKFSFFVVFALLIGMIVLLYNVEMALYVERYIKTIFALIFIIFVSFLYSFFKRKGIVRRLLEFFGKYSLEYYIMFAALAEAIVPLMKIDDKSFITQNVAAFIITTIIVVLVKKVVDDITKIISTPSKNN